LGGILVTEAVKLICGIGDSLLGRMLVLEALGQRTREVPVVPMTPDAVAHRTAPDAVRDGADAHARTGESTAPSHDRTAATRNTRHVALDALGDHTDAMLLDVREPDEFARGSIPGAVSVPLGEVLSDAASVSLDPRVIVFCQTGPRARAAA